MSYIYAVIDKAQVTFVGCAKDHAQIPEGAVILQEVATHAEIAWVKWSLRFRRTLKDTRALSNPFADYFTNTARLKRLLGDEEAVALQISKNAEFLKFHVDNRHVLDEMLSQAKSEKAAGRAVYSVSEHIGQVRWGGTSTDRGDDRFKINDTWAPWYSRAMQMVCPELIGFFRMRECLADYLVWIDGRSWAEFSAEHSENLRWSEAFEDLADSSWEYHEGQI